MKLLMKLYSFLIIFCLVHQISSIIKGSVDFGTGDEPPIYRIRKADTYLIKSSFPKDTYKFLYIYPYINTNNKGTYKIFFKKYEENDNEANILNAEYYSLDINSALVIEAKKLDYTTANIFIVAYNSIDIDMRFGLVNNFPVPSVYFLNQFFLPKGQTFEFEYLKETDQIDAIIILSKYSLRNLGIKAKNGKDKPTEDITFTRGGYLYPNGYSVILDLKVLSGRINSFTIENKKNGARDEIISIGYNEYEGNNMFPFPIINGLQFYLEKVYESLGYVQNSLSNPFYFTYQVYGKKLEFLYTNSESVKRGNCIVEDYNSMVPVKIDTAKMAFKFGSLKTGLYAQFLDFNDLKVVQQSLQPLTTGLPKSILIPQKKSLYHFLPVSKDSKEIHYYIRQKSQNSKMFVSLKTCESYPENCYFEEKLTTSTALPLIDNVGMWYTQDITNSSSLQLIYVYCETECAYDVIMSYDNDPLFMFPDNNYTKFLGENKKDIFALPVFDYLSTMDEIKIDLTILSGKAKLTLYESRENLNANSPIPSSDYKSEIIGQRQSYIISKDTFIKANYYQKELYVLVEGDPGSFYNLMYTSGSTNNRILENNRVFTDVLKVDSEEVKTYSIKNNGKSEYFYIAINSLSCKTSVTINDGQTTKPDGTTKNHLIELVDYGTTKKSYTVEISLKSSDNKDNICKEGFEEQITIYAYNIDNTNILFNENSLISSTTKRSNINFKYLFKPISDDINSYNLEIDRLSQYRFTLEYRIDRISFDKTQAENTEKYSFSQGVISKENSIITSDKILSICNELNSNEICSLTISINPQDNTHASMFSFYLNLNNKDYIRPLTEESIVSSLSSNNAHYFYIDLNKNYDTEILVNSFGDDVELKYDIVKDKTKIVVPFPSFDNGKNYHQLHISKSEYESCGSFCRAIIGVHLPKTKNELNTVYSISYLFRNETNQAFDLLLPINYYARYKFEDLSEIYFSWHAYDYPCNVVLELISESPNIIFNSSVEYKGNKVELISDQKLNINGLQNDRIKIKVPNKGKDSSFRVKLTSIGKQPSSTVYPMLSSFSETCKISACYYIIDKTPDMVSNQAFFYVPESEDIYLSIQDLDFGFAEDTSKDINQYLSLTKEYNYNSKGKMQRPNWCEYNINEVKSYLVRLSSLTGNKMNVNLFTAFSTRPNTITLNYGEKRIFKMEKNGEDEITINIPKATGNKNKYRINLHSVKGNGVFKILEQTYPLGLFANFKEDISIIIDSDNFDKYLVLKASNKYDETIINDFVFSIDYSVESKDKLIYEIENEKVNSFKFNKNGALSNIHFYMKANYTLSNQKQVFKDINMNIKIYTKNAEFDIKSYIINETTLEACKDGSINVPDDNIEGTIKNYIKGGKSENGELALSKLEIDSEAFNKYVNGNNKLYVYLIFTQKNSQNNKVKIDLYPYDMTNKKALAKNELFIQKIPPKSLNYQFLLVKSDLYETYEILIEYSPPKSKKYEFGVMHSQNKDNEIIRQKMPLTDEKSDMGIKLALISGAEKLRYLLFNIYANQNDLENNKDMFLFKYRHKDATKYIYFENNMLFNVTGSTNKLVFNINSYQPRYKSGESILIIKGYKNSDISQDMTVFSLLFSDINPIFTHYISGSNKEKEEVSVNLSAGDYTFACIQVILDNEREEYIVHKSSSFNLKEGDEKKKKINEIIDYIKNHIAATIIIIVVVILFIAIMINICRHEKKKGRAKVEVNVNEVEEGNLVN